MQPSSARTKPSLKGFSKKTHPILRCCSTQRRKEGKAQRKKWHVCLTCALMGF